MRHLPIVTLSESDGVRHLHFGNEWIQGSMRLSRPDRLELEYAQQMMSWLLFLETKKNFRITQLGLGTGMLSKFCYMQLPLAQVEAVEINPAVIIAARSMFYLPPDNRRLHVIEQDALEYVSNGEKVASADVLQLDLYDARARGPVLGSLAFYQACRATLRSPGVLTVNLFGNHASFNQHVRRLRQAFSGRVLLMPQVHDGNVVALAFQGPPLMVSKADLLARAKIIQQAIGLPSKKWVTDLFSANQFDNHLCI